MVQHERRVECRIAEVHHLKVDEIDSAVVNQQVLGAEVAMHQADSSRGALLDQCVYGAGDIEIPDGDRAVVGIDTKLIERRLVAISFAKVAALPCSSDELSE